MVPLDSKSDLPLEWLYYEIACFYDNGHFFSSPNFSKDFPISKRFTEHVECVMCSFNGFFSLRVKEKFCEDYLT